MAIVMRSISSPSKIWAKSYHTFRGSTSSYRPHSWLLNPKNTTPISMRASSLASLSTVVVPPSGSHDSLLKYHFQSTTVWFPENIDEKSRYVELIEGTREKLLTDAGPVEEKMRLIDTIERLGISYHFENDINHILQILPTKHSGQDLFTTSLCFRLLRRNGHHISADVFGNFMDDQGKFKESIKEDTMGMLSLYEASYMGANREDVLLQAQKFTKAHLKETLPLMESGIGKQVLQSLELPKHLRMARLEARRYIEEYSSESDHNSSLLQLAKLDYNQVQSLHQMELAEISRWWKHLGLVDKLSFARDRPIECFLWTVGILPEPKYSGCRIELAKTIAILLVIDDIFDTHGSYDELVLFTNAIRRWDLNAMEELPEYMKICYMALYNTTNEICYKILKENGSNVLHSLKTTWIDMIEGFMVEAKWLNKGEVPNLEEYIENGVTTAGSYMALVHIFFLIGQGVTQDNLKLLINRPYPKLFSSAGRILRLWDDLGTAKEEQERGDLVSSIQIFMREKEITCEDEARKQIIELVQSLWKDLNGDLMAPNALPLPIIKACLNMARTSQVVYQHDEDSYFASVDNYVHSLFFTPITI